MQSRRPCFDSWLGKIPWRRDRLLTHIFLGFPGGSDGKESSCNAGDSSSIPGLGRSAEEGIGYPLHYSWASLVGQMVKKSAHNAGDLGLIPGLGRSPGEGIGYQLQDSAWRIPWGCKELDTTMQLSLHLILIKGLPRWH